MLKKIIFSCMVLLLAMLFSYTVSAQQGATQGTAKDASKLFPAVATEYADSTELIALLCDEVKWQGGEPISKLEALDEALSPIAKDIASLELDVEIKDYGLIASELRDKIKAVCGATDIGAAESSLSEFVNLADRLKADLSSLGNYLKTTLEPTLRSKGKALEEGIKDELAAKAQELEAMAEADLRAEAEEEVAAKKEVITAQIKQEVKSRLQPRIDAGEFGDPPDEGMVQDTAMAMAGSRIDEERAKLEKEIEDKYLAQAKVKEAELREELNEEAEKLRTTAMDKFDMIAEAFSTLEEDILALAESKYTGTWEKFRASAESKKAALVGAIVDAQVDKAKELIEAERELIALAIQEGKPVKTANTLIAELESGGNKLVTAILDTDLSDAAVNSLKDEFQATWQSVQEEMELIKARSAKEVIDKVAYEISRTDLIDVLKAHLSWGKNILAFVPRWQSWCANPKTAFPRSVNALSRCSLCDKISGGHNQPMYDLINRLSPRINIIIPALMEAEAFQSRANVSLEEALAMKSRAQAAVNQAKAMQNEYENWQEADRNITKEVNAECSTKLDQYTP